jgi:hypothetical protein
MINQKIFRNITFAFCLFTFASAFLSLKRKRFGCARLSARATETRKDAGKGREFIRRELEKIKRAGLNTVYLEAFWDGYTIYPSRVAAATAEN